MSSSTFRGLDRRRRGRPSNPVACPACGAPEEQLHITLRQSRMVFFKCRRCKGVFTLEVKLEPTRQGRAAG